MVMFIAIAFTDLLKWTLVLLTLPVLLELLGLTLASLFAPGWSSVSSLGRLPASPTSPSDSASTERVPSNPSSRAVLSSVSAVARSGSLPAVERLMVVVPSHNEELCIARCIASVAAAAGSVKNILVVAHNCVDRTAELAEMAGVRVLVLNDQSQQGKGHAVKHGLHNAFIECGADAVLIIDADSTVSSNMTEVVGHRLTEAPVLQCRDQVLNPQASWRTRLMSLAFTGMNVIRPRGRDRLGLSCGIFGNGFAIRREVMEQVGYTVNSIVEDLEFHLVLVERGYRVRFVEEALVLADMPLSGTDAASQRSRWEGGRMRLLTDWGWPLFRGTIQGKFLLVEPLIDLLSLPLALEVMLLLVLLLFPGMGARSYALSAFAIILFHLVVVIEASPDRMGSIQALLCSPLYVFWRIAMIPSIVRASRSGAAWIRTRRDSSF